MTSAFHLLYNTYHHSCNRGVNRENIFVLAAFPNGTVKNLCSGSVAFASRCGHVESVETPTHPLATKMATQAPGDEPAPRTALWAIGGFIFFAAIFFILVIYGPF
jgi:hypothetical protein